MKRFVLRLALLPVLLASPAFAQLRIVSYNSSGNVAGAGTTLSTVLDAIGDESRAGIQRPVDILSLQEQDLALASTARALNTLNSLYGAGTYAASTLRGTGDTTQSVVYRVGTTQLVAQQAFLTTSTSGAPRQPLRFQFRPVGYTSTADFYVYSSHYKASDDSASATRRGIEAAGTRANADALGTGVRAIYTGDFNTYRASEAAIVNLTAAGGPGRAFDPVNRLGDWNNNGAFADVHTQSPVVTTGTYYEYQVGGGLDDRFDFQLLTAPMLTQQGVSYISGSYHTFGNAGLQFNRDVTYAGAAAALRANFPGYSTADVQAVLQALAQNSDHLPVVADYRLPAKLALVSAEAPSRVIQDATVTLAATIGNVAPVATIQGAAVLNYAVSVSNSTTPLQSGVVPATQTQTRTFTLDTTNVGPRTASVSVSSNDPGIPSDAANGSVEYAVLAHATPSLSPTSPQVTSGTLDLGIVAIGRTAAASVAVFNLGDLPEFVARLNLTGGTLTGSTAFAASDVMATHIVAGASHDVGVTFTPLAFGAATADLTLTTADEALPGALARAALDVHVDAFGAFAGDANLSNTVDFDDLLALASNFGESSGADWFDGDFNQDDAVNFDDLLDLAGRYGYDGTTPPLMMAADAAFSDAFIADWTLARSLVPEPTFGLAAVAMLVFVRRNRH